MAIQPEKNPIPTNYITKVKATDGSTYMIKDANVWGSTNPQNWRSDHSNASLIDIVDNLSNYSDFLGVTTSAISEGSTTAQIIINNDTITAQKGNIVLKDSKEFIWNGTSWSEFGDLSAITDQLGDLAYKDTATATYTPAGSVSQPNFNGTAATITAKGTPAGTVSKPTFSGTAVTISAKGTPAGTVSKPTFSGTATTLSLKGTPAGTVSKPTFSGTAATVVAKGTPAGTVSQPTFSGIAATISAIGTPSGTVSKPDITVTNSTKAINYVTGRGTLPTLTVQTNSNDSQMLEFVFTQGALCSTASINATTNVTAALAAAPTFTGASLSTTAAYTPEGTVSQPTFSGASLSATAAYTPAGSVSQPTFSGAELTSTVAYTPAGSVSQPTFSGAELTSTASYTPAGTVSQPTFTGAELSATAAYTPAGTVTKPTFSGTQATITVS